MSNTIKIEDLRVGNKIFHNDSNRVVTVREITSTGVEGDFGDEITWVEIDQFSGIPITKELLIEARFDEIFFEEYCHHLLDLISFDKADGVFYYSYCVGDDDRRAAISTEIKYIHQLQNAFKVFTGKELTFKK